nr:F-box only protein 21 isoform X1 [Anas platyrhynchos]XP_027310769.1 F-box only protein 21 isoform X1 [Anas platyrhynchos]XP_038033453.1 F-box only protein 21 isoform X1 [Anas platyrhynchos]|eukprot:XP_005017921.1 F-box only protein 21 isoform X1 [Anas platyrhynchos]
MPHINAAAALQFCMLLSALPAQYFLSQWYGTDSAQRIQITERLLIACGSSFTKSYLSVDAWADRLKLWLLKTRNWYFGEKKIKSANTEAENHSYFAESTQVRSPKPESIQFSVGQVIVHKRLGYSGVIVGWDVKAKAPEEWLQHKYPPAKQDVRDTPHYRILINKANGFGKSTTYIPEEEITIIMGLEVHHPDMKAYFSGYDGSKYIMQPWLKKIYPHD